MPEENVTPEPEGQPQEEPAVEPTVGPDYEQLYSELKESSQEQLQGLQQEIDRRQASANAKMQQLENLLVESLNSGRQPQVDPSHDVDLSDPNAALKLVDQMLDKKLRQSNQQVTAALQSMQVSTFEKEKAQFKQSSPELYKVLNSEIDNYFAEYPDERARPGAFDEVVTYLKGKNFDRVVETVRPAPTRGAPPTPTPSAPTGPDIRDKPPELTLSAEEARLAAIYGALEGRAPYTAEEWHSVRNDYQKFPGRRGGK